MSTHDTPVRFKSLAEFMMAMAAGAFTGRAVHLVVVHDDGCTPERCRCSPEYVVEELTAENLRRGAREHEAWAKGSRS